MVLHYGLVCISLVDNEVEHLLIHLLAILASYSVIYLFYLLLIFLLSAFNFLFISYLYQYSLDLVNDVCYKYIFPVCSLSFHFLVMSFDIWAFLILMMLTLSAFFFMDCAFCHL